MTATDGALAAAGRRPRIALLPPRVAARIAAGEVIERPASVVKELIENALDAGARSIEIAVEHGGIERIRVRDDGSGIPPEQLADAFERHATSKLRSEQELFAVRTLGFRGEALAAIVAAADVTVTTRPPEQTAAAVARYRDGRPERSGSAAGAPGTTVEVRELFAALPARRRFLRAPRAEGRAVTRVVADYALGYPAVAFRLTLDARAALTAPGGGTLREAVAAVHGEALAAVLLPVAHERSDGAGEAEVRVSGAVGPPALHRGSRSYIHLFANGRAIVDRSLTHAVERAFAGLLPGGRHPVAMLSIDVPPEQIDVNVHPTKAEVRLRHERLVFAAVQAAVVEAIAASPVAAVTAPAGWPAVTAAWPSQRGGGTRPGDGPSSGREVIAGARGAVLVAPAAAGTRAPDGGATGGAEGGLQAPLAMHERLPALRPLGQVESTYIVAEAPDGMYLVDQHAAHERVLYERLGAARAAGEAASQPLLASAVVALKPAHAALAEELAGELAALGWDLDATDGAAVLLRAVPAALAAGDPERALVEYLDRVEAEERLSGPDRAVASLACRAAVMAGDRVEAAQQRELLRALEQAATPHTCPHGRPTMLHLSRAALERSFGRR